MSVKPVFSIDGYLRRPVRGDHMNTALLRLAAILSVVMLSPAQALAADAQAGATAAIVQPLSLVKTRDLEFGAMLAGTSGGSVVVNPNTDARTSSGAVTLAGTGGHAAQFMTYGGPLQFVWVTRGPLPVLTRQGGGGSMNVSQLSLNGSAFRFLSSAGLVDLRIGGTLQVNANQPSGHYEGDFEITVTYF